MNVVTPSPRGRLGRALRELLRADAGPSPAARKRPQDLGDYPPPYPTGWYRVANSNELKRGELRRVTCLGEELVVYRADQSGQVHVVDAHCPHQGADLSVGGTVECDGLRCPFHHWRFGPDGRLAEVPGLEQPPRISLRMWPTRELHGMVWIFRHHDGVAREPLYELPEHDDLASGQLVYRGQYDAGAVDMHLIEFAENSVDFQHFVPLHGQMLVPWTSIPVPGVTVEHQPAWSIDEQLAHVTTFRNHASLKLFGRTIPRASADAEITIFGPGGIVWFCFDIPDVGKITMFQSHTPVAPRRQRVYFRWFAEPSVPRPLVAYVVGSWISNWRADIAIWESKVYRRKPMLCRIDGPITQMRRWYEQFYAEAAVSPGNAESLRSVPPVSTPV